MMQKHSEKWYKKIFKNISSHAMSQHWLNYTTVSQTMKQSTMKNHQTFLLKLKKLKKLLPTQKN